MYKQILYGLTALSKIVIQYNIICSLLLFTFRPCTNHIRQARESSINHIVSKKFFLSFGRYPKNVTTFLLTPVPCKFASLNTNKIPCIQGWENCFLDY